MAPKFNKVSAGPFPASLRLNNWQDWHIWYSTFKNRAELLQVWDLIDPYQSDQDGDTVKFPDVPLMKDYREEGQTEPLTTKQAQRYKEDSTDYFKLEKIALRKQGALIAMQSLFESTIAKRFLQMTLDHQTLRQKLKALTITVKPSTEMVRNQLSTELKRLESTPYGQEVFTYLERWQDLFYKIKGQLPKADQYSTLSESELCKSFNYTLLAFDPNMAKLRLVDIAMDTAKHDIDTASMAFEIKVWRSHLALAKVERFPTNNNAAKNMKKEIRR